MFKKIMDYKDVKIFVQAAANYDGLTSGKHYEIVQRIEHKQDKYLAVIDDNNSITAFLLICFTLNE